MTLVDTNSVDRSTGFSWRPILWRSAPPVAGIAIVVTLWWFAGLIFETHPRFAAFRGFTVDRTFAAFVQLVASGDAWRATAPSLSRVVQGLGWAFVIGAPVGLAIGTFAFFERMAQLPFQILRMVSPLAWMPIAVLAFPSWDGAIVFLITAAAVWPIVFATAASVKRIDPLWLAMARNLGGRPFSVLVAVIIPAVAQDILIGLRLALGVAWIVLVPAEFLGVTSGLGYAINDARDTLSYDRLAALVLLIGLIGYVFDAFINAAVRRTQWTPTA
ncbi:MAG: ABC transporter permease [Xanthobacteraceae bacterium]